jgi:hypothetical protein
VSKCLLVVLAENMCVWGGGFSLAVKEKLSTKSGGNFNASFHGKVGWRLVTSAM